MTPTITLSNGMTLQGGEYLLCDIYDRPLRVVDYLTNSLGMFYQNQGGRLVRVFIA